MAKAKVKRQKVKRKDGEKVKYLELEVDYTDTIRQP